MTASATHPSNRARPARAQGSTLRLSATWRDALIVLGFAVGLRLAFAALTADTYDPDEFVVLALSRDMAQGSVPYRDFTFFHPPGVLVLFRALQPIVDLWWPAARMAMVLIDSATALLVWRIGALLFGRRGALAAGLIYAASPVPLLASIRVGQDPIITVLGLGGLLFLLSRRSLVNAALAGLCLGVAVWFKYPALLFLPVYALAAPRRVWATILAAAATTGALFAPFAPELHALWAQSVGWQALHRPYDDAAHRLAAVAAFWLLLNPLALPAALRFRAPPWMRAGFALGGVFALTPEVYYHYFVPVVPFAALLAAPLLASVWRRSRVPALVVGAVLFGLWTAALNVGRTQAGMGVLRFSTLHAVVQVVDRSTARGEPLVTDQFEYGYLGRRATVTSYFWDMSNDTAATTLERNLPSAGAVIGTEGGSYPPGFVQYLNRRGYLRVRAGDATIWLMSTTRQHTVGRRVDHVAALLSRPS